MVNADKIGKTVKTLGKILACGAGLYVGSVFFKSAGTYTYGQNFLDSKTTGCKFIDYKADQKQIGLMSDGDLFNYAVQNHYLNDPTMQRLMDISTDFISTPEQSRKKISFDHYSHIYLDHKKSIPLLDILAQAEREQKDSILFEVVTEKENQNRYRIVPVNKLSTVYQHNQQSQNKLGLKNVDLVIKNTGAESGYFSCTPFLEYQIELDETCMLYSADVLNFITDHEAGHALQAAKNFGWVAEREVNWVKDKLGLQESTEIEDEADYIAAKLNPKAAKGAFELLFPVPPFENITLQQYERTVADISGNRGHHSPNMTRIKNVLHFSEKAVQPK